MITIDKLNYISNARIKGPHSTVFNGCGRSTAATLDRPKLTIRKDRFSSTYSVYLADIRSMKHFGFDFQEPPYFSGKLLDDCIDKMYKWFKHPHEILRNEIGEIL